MQIFDDIAPLKAHLRGLQRQGVRVGLVPTMGALHEGHLSLVRTAQAHCDVVVASVFVNPTQFGPNEDLDRYPRDLAGDSQKLEQAGCDLLFHPSTAMIYPPGHQTTVILSEVTQGLCGAHRPGHFDGVTTVVAALFSIVRPDIAVFGEKDYQQLAALRIMARDLHLDVEVLGAPLVREPDGVAMSSRNLLLSPNDRIRARALSRGLFAAQASYEAGERNAALLLDVAREVLRSEGVEPEYLELRHGHTLVPLESAEGPCVILVAARLGQTRILDNVILQR